MSTVLTVFNAKVLVEYVVTVIGQNPFHKAIKLRNQLEIQPDQFIKAYSLKIALL